MTVLITLCLLFKEPWPDNKDHLIKQIWLTQTFYSGIFTTNVLNKSQLRTFFGRPGSIFLPPNGQPSAWRATGQWWLRRWAADPMIDESCRRAGRVSPWPSKATKAASVRAIGREDFRLIAMKQGQKKFGNCLIPRIKMTFEFFHPN